MPRRRAALLFLVLFVAACGANLFVCKPLQERGVLDSSAVIVNSIATIVALPGILTSRLFHIRRFNRLFLPGNEHASIFIFTAMFASAALWILAFVWLRRRSRRRAQTPPDATPPSTGCVSRRRLLRRGLLAAAGSATALLGSYVVLVEPRWPRLLRLRFRLRGLSRELAGLRVVHLTDLHLGWFTSAAYLEGIVEQSNALRPDLVLLTGDYVHGSSRFIEPAAKIIGGLRSRLGSVGVLGNHDHWEGAAPSRRALSGPGRVLLVDHGRVFVTPRALSPRPDGAGLCVGGVGDLWEDKTDLEAALGGVSPSLPRILLSHNPDYAETAMALERKHRVDLMLAGHTHGGQVRLPIAGALITPSRYGAKYAAGLVEGPAFPVFVSTGLGVTILPVRFRVRPEIVLFELVPA
jgi:uncharacterized protein